MKVSKVWTRLRRRKRQKARRRRRRGGGELQCINVLKRGGDFLSSPFILFLLPAPAQPMRAFPSGRRESAEPMAAGPVLPHVDGDRIPRTISPPPPRPLGRVLLLHPHIAASPAPTFKGLFFICIISTTKNLHPYI